MNGIQFNFWAIIILLGAVQGLLLCLYLFVKKENRPANKWLAFLLVSVSVHLIEYAADITGITLQYPGLIAITYPLLFLWGPFYYFYCRRLLQGPGRNFFQSLLHFLPALIVLAVMMPFYTMDAGTKLNSLKAMVNNNLLIIPGEQLVFMGAHVIQTVSYLFAAFRFISIKQKELKDHSSDVLVVKKLQWLNGFNRAFAVYLLLYSLLVILLSVINKYQLQLDYMLLLVTSVSMYAIGYAAIGNPEIFKAMPRYVAAVQEAAAMNMDEKIRNIGRFPELKERLLYVMSTNKPYLKSDLKISDLADLLSVPEYQLSQLINDAFLVNFYDFINKYRVEEARKLLIEDDRNYKILSIAYEAGFNSKATFNRVFKKFTGLTPTAFRQQHSAAP